MAYSSKIFMLAIELIWYCHWCHGWRISFLLVSPEYYTYHFIIIFTTNLLTWRLNNMLVRSYPIIDIHRQTRQSDVIFWIVRLQHVKRNFLSDFRLIQNASCSKKYWCFLTALRFHKHLHIFFFFYTINVQIYINLIA